MGEHSYIKCQQCGKINHNLDHCQSCGAMINIVLKRRIEEDRKRKEKLEQSISRNESSIEHFFTSANDHPNSLIRFLASTVQFIWTFLAMVVGALIAFVVAVAAG